MIDLSRTPEQRAAMEKEIEEERHKIRAEMKLAHDEYLNNGKVKINNLLFVSLPCTISLRDMDIIAMKIVGLIDEAWRNR